MLLEERVFGGGHERNQQTWDCLAVGLGTFCALFIAAVLNVFICLLVTPGFCSEVSSDFWTVAKRWLTLPRLQGYHD
jgi:hypothetical protein